MNCFRATDPLNGLFDRSIRSRPGSFSLPSGQHFIQGDSLPTRLCHISNNDHGPKRILFDVDAASDLVLDGQGAILNCTGEILPIRVGNSRSITIRNLTIDWVRPFFTQAELADCGDGWIEFVYDRDRYPLEVENNRLVAMDASGWKTDRLWNLLPFDSRLREVRGTRENWHLAGAYRAQRLSADRVRLFAAFTEQWPAGTPIVLMHGNRAAPGIWIENSAGVTIENVTIHHAPGMGVIAQCSQNITLDRLHVVPTGDRLFSTWVDAVHATDCDGATRIIDCELRGQFDDAINLHARFSLVVERPSPSTARIRTIHPQHAGPSPATPGAGWAFYRRRDLKLVQVTRVTSALPVDNHTTEITLDDLLPDEDGELVCARFDPESTVEIRGCRFGANRGRGVLMNLEHRAIIDGNHFHVSGRAIESVPDANYWWEGSPVRDLTVRNNTFEDCGFGPCGEDVFYLGPELPDGSDPRAGPLRDTAHKPAPCESPALSNIRIKNNTVVRHRGRVLHAHGVDGLVFRGNRITDSRVYPVIHPPSLIDLGPGVRNTDICAD